jgi:hypothetical protein
MKPGMATGEGGSVQIHETHLSQEDWVMVEVRSGPKIGWGRRLPVSWDGMVLKSHKSNVQRVPS